MLSFCVSGRTIAASAVISVAIEVSLADQLPKDTTQPPSPSGRLSGFQDDEGC